MGTILVVERDPVFGAVLEDRLHVAGHRVELLRSPDGAVSLAAETAADLVIYEPPEPGDAGLELIRAFRQRPETRSLPVLVLAEGGESADRVAALRAGADDYLARPCDFEELMLRAERLVGVRAAQAPVLHGDLANHPLWELLQYIRQARKSGYLVLRGKSRSGRIQLRDGRAVAAQSEKLPAEEALLALLGLKEGRFRFVTDAAEAAVAPEREIRSIHELLLQAAWLEDETDKRRAHLPVRGTPLRSTGRPAPPLGDELERAGLPVAEIHRLVSAEPALRLHDLMDRLPLAPQKIRLAVAWLIEHGAVAPPAERAMESFPTTSEIDSELLIDIAVGEFLKAARQAGFATSALPFLVLAEPGVWPALIELFSTVPGFRGNDDLVAFVDQLKLRRGGSVTFATGLGKLSLHAQELKGGVREQTEAIVSACAGVMVWLDDAGEAAQLRGVIERLERVKGDATGLLVVPRETARAAALELADGTERWRVISHAPQSLLGVLRLLQPSRRT